MIFLCHFEALLYLFLELRKILVNFLFSFHKNYYIIFGNDYSYSLVIILTNDAILHSPYLLIMKFTDSTHRLEMCRITQKISVQLESFECP